MHVCMFSLVISQLLLYHSVVFAVVAVMDFTRTHKSTVVVVVAAVDIIRLVLLLLFLLWRFTRTHKSADMLCTIWCILGTIRYH